MSSVRAADRPVKTTHLPHPMIHRAATLDRDGPSDFYKLKLMGIALPAGFVIAIEVCRLVFVERGLTTSLGHLVLGLVMLVSVAGFGTAMFWYIDRAHRLVVRQNRELSAVNAVAVAIRGDLGPDQIIDAALHAMITASGAAEGSVTAFAPEGRLPHEDGVTWQRVVRAVPGAGSAPSGALAGVPDQFAEFPLLAGGARVGSMRLRWPAGSDGAIQLSDDILRNIGEQVGSAIQRAQLFADLERGKREGHALYDLLLRISSQQSAVDTLAAIVSCASDLLGADEAVLCLKEAVARSLPLDPGNSGPFGPVCVEIEAAQARAAHQPACARRSSAGFPATLSASLRGPKGTLGTLWLGRRTDMPFTGRDTAYLGTLSEFAVIAIGSARMLENERQGAILAERERIAREMHDSLAQVLGVTHLRLRALGSRPEVGALEQLRAEVADLAEICHEAYRDVREAILGLHESSQPHRALLESLHAYAEKFSRQSGITTTLESNVDHDLALAPRCEVQVIRVIQEALTNVRKHSGARTALIHIQSTPVGTTFVIEDDGQGFEPAEVPSDRDSFGIVSMTERIRLVSGILTIDSAPGRGTRVIATLPSGSHQALAAASGRRE